MFPRVPAALAAFLMLGTSLAHAQQPAGSRRDLASAKLVNDVCVDHRATSPQGHAAPKPASPHRTSGRAKQSPTHNGQKAAREACPPQTGQQQMQKGAGQRPRQSRQDTKAHRPASVTGQHALAPADGVKLPKVPRSKHGH